MKKGLIIVLVIVLSVLCSLCIVGCGNLMGSLFLNFEKIYSECGCESPWAEYGDDYITIDSNPYDYDGDSYYSTTYIFEASDAIKEINEKLGLPDYLYDEMQETRAIDGRQSFSGDKVDVSWRYHPDSGLEVRYTKK